MNKEPIVCQFHIGAINDGLVPGELPSTSSDSALNTAWTMTTDKLFSQDGSPVWICPDCFRKTGYHTRRKAAGRRRWQSGGVIHFTLPSGD